MAQRTLTEVWQASRRLFPRLWQAASTPAAAGTDKGAFGRALRHLGLHVQPVEGEEATWLMEGVLWVRLAPAGADLEAEAARLKAAMRRAEPVQAGYVVQPVPDARPRLRWVMLLAGSVKADQRPTPENG